MYFLYNEPAMFHKGALIIGDTHFGIEERLTKDGIYQKNITEMMFEKVVELITQTNAKKLIILGDVKENILTLDEKTKTVLERLSELVEVIIVKGNHDGGIEQVKSIRVEPSHGFVYEGLGLVHGHAFPDEKIMQCDYLISAHQHIQYDFFDKNKKQHTEKIWAILSPSSNEIKKHYKKFNKKIKLILMPPFNFLVGRSITKSQKESLGPLFNNKLFKLDHEIIYRLDGICVGKI